MSYYDVDAILTDAEKVPCTFELDVPDLGHLDNNPAQPLKAGTQISLPLWLAEMLAIANASGGGAGGGEAKPFVTLNMPPALSDAVVQALKADARAVPLRDQTAHFYGLATRMLDLFEERELGVVVRRAFVARASEIALHARKAGGAAAASSSSSSGGAGGAGAGDEGGGGGGSNLGVGGTGEEFLRGLDEAERKLFRKAHDGVKAGKEWMDTVKKH